MKLSTHATQNASPWFVLRCLVSQALGRSNQVLQCYRKDRISRVDLEQDLRVLVPQPRPVMFDVGANKGQTLAMFQRVFNKPVIHAFEPNKSLVELTLSPAHRGNPDVVINAAALGAEAGSLTFHESENNELSSFLSLEANEQNPFKGTTVQTNSTVPVWILDQYVKERELPPLDLLKIDTQGYDLHVLQGAREQLKAGRISLVMLEINFVPMYAGQPTFGEVDAFLREHGYALMDMYEKIYQDNRLAWCTGLYQKC